MRDLIALVITALVVVIGINYYIDFVEEERRKTVIEEAYNGGR